MRLGKASAYATFATVYVAEHQGDGPVTARRIAGHYGIPPEYLLKIMQQLVHARILDSETGRRGGFKLRKSAERTTLLEIVEAIEGPLRGEVPLEERQREVAAAAARVERTCNGIARMARALLRDTTIAQLVRAT